MKDEEEEEEDLVYVVEVEVLDEDVLEDEAETLARRVLEVDPYSGNFDAGGPRVLP